MTQTALPYGFRSAGLDWTQVEPGSFSGGLTSLHLNSVRLFRDRFNMGSQWQGDLLPSTVVIGTLAAPGTQARWFGMPATQDDVGVGRRSIDVAALGAGGFFSVVLELDRAVEPFPVIRAALPAGDEPYLIRSVPSAKRLRDFLRAVFALGDADPAALRRTPMRTQIEGALHALLRRPGEGYRIIPSASFAGRFQAVRICEAYMRERVAEPISLQALSDFSGFRPRSLINAFEVFNGLSPMAYLKAYRLNGVRKVLLSTAEHQKRIIDIAMDWGFEHMGHFAADYRAMFGERPSETARALQRRERRRAGRTFVAEERAPRLRHQTRRLHDDLAARRARADLDGLIEAERA